jgi:energy-coupling factor transport system ATP-binding protein
VTRPAAVSACGWGWRHAGRAAWAVRDLDLTVQPGERVLLLGPSGSGKSTLLAGLAGLLHGQDSGEQAGALLVDGVPAHQVRHRSGLLLQDPEAQLIMSRAGDDVAFGLENFATPPSEIWPRVAEALEMVGFRYGTDRLTAALSGGEKQRLAFAGIVAMRPGLLLLDEPTANLDPGGAGQIRESIAAVLAQTGATIVVVEHRVEPWLELLDRVVVLDRGGGVLADGTPARVFTEHRAQLAASGVWLPGSGSGHRSARARSAEPGGAALVRAEGVSYRYRRGGPMALHPSDITIGNGEVVAVVGANGSGKSTLAALVAGLSRPETGTVVGVDDPRPLHRRPAHSLVQLTGTVFQDPEHQFLRSTVRAELMLAPRRLGWSAARSVARADELLQRLRLSRLAGANPFTLSGGEKRRLSVATALAVAPRLLVLDEPTFGQDAATWTELLDLLASIRADGGGQLVVSHDGPFVAALADRSLRMTDGRLAVAELVG